MAQPDPTTDSKNPARRRTSTILRVAFALISRDSEPKQYLGYLGLGAGQLAYYSSKDKAVLLRDLGRGQERVALQLSGHFVISPDATGTSPAVPSGNPIVRPPWLFVPDFGKLVALRID